MVITKDTQADHIHTLLSELSSGERSYRDKLEDLRERMLVRIQDTYTGEEAYLSLEELRDLLK